RALTLDTVAAREEAIEMSGTMKEWAGERRGWGHRDCPHSVLPFKPPQSPIPAEEKKASDRTSNFQARRPDWGSAFATCTWSEACITPRRRVRPCRSEQRAPARDP
ncbi:MAG: hypothetical protein PVJ55_07255, partial [Anaerolineae bacterium]